MAAADLVVRNWRLKLIALALALLLWVTMRISDDRVDIAEIGDVPVRVDKVGDDWVLLGEPTPATVELTVAGGTGDLMRADRSGLEVVIPMDSVAQEDVVVELASEWVGNLDRDAVVIEDIAPSTVRLLFERRRTVDIPVSMRFAGALPDTLAFLEEPRSNLLIAQVRGVESAVAGLETVFLTALDLGTVTASGPYAVAVDTLDLEDLRVTPDRASITVAVATRQERILGPFPVQHAALGPGVTVVPDSVTITLSGAAAVLHRVDAAGVRVRVAADQAAVLRGLDEHGEIRVPLEILGLVDLMDASATPDAVTVEREAAPPESDDGPP